VAVLRPIQNSFSAGELSPKMWTRTDTQGYRHGLAECLNMVTDSRGPARNRDGMQFIGRHLADTGRVMTFQVNDTLLYNLLLLDYRMVVTSPVGGISKQQVLLDPFFQSGMTHWEAYVSGRAFVSFEPGLVVLRTRNSASVAAVRQQFTVEAGSVDFGVIADGDPKRIMIGTTAGGADVYDTETSLHKWTETLTLPAGTYWIEVRAEGAVKRVDVHAVGASVAGADLVEVVTPWSEWDTRDLHFVQAPSGRSIYILHRYYPPHKLIYDETTEGFSLEQVVFTSPPAEWEDGSWPATGAIFKGRLYLSGVRNMKQAIWASVAGIYEDFTMGAADDDGFLINIERYGAVRGLSGFKNLMVNTENGEHIVTSEGGVLTPGDHQVEQQSSYGSNTVQPMQVGDQIFYISPDNRKLRAMEYSWDAQNWLSKDLTFTSDHITAAGIEEVCWAQHPDNLFWCVLGDGTLGCMTYDRSDNIYGWHRHETQGEVVSMSAGTYLGHSLVALLVLRQDGYVHHEVITPNSPPMDSSVVRHLDNLTDVVDNLEHLEGATVQVVADGAVHPDRVVSGGQITLEYKADEVVVGLGYSKKLRSMPFDLYDPANSMMGMTKRWAKVYLRLIDSYIPLINGMRPPVRDAVTPMTTPDDPITGDVDVYSLGHDHFAQVEIEQDLPLPLTVVGFFGKLAVS